MTNDAWNHLNVRKPISSGIVKKIISSKNYWLTNCMYVCVCVRARVCVCVRACIDLQVSGIK